MHDLPHFAAVAIVGWLMVAGCTGNEDEPSACERLRDHVLDVSLGDVAAADRAQHRAALEASMGDFVATCSSHLSTTQVSCGLQAPTPMALSTCMTVHGGR